MSFLIKSFFFFLIGLMFPTNPRLIIMGAVAVAFLFIFRIPAVMLVLRGRGFAPKERRLVDVSIPRGLAAGVLATLPLQYGIAGMENLAPALFALIVFSILAFAIGYYIVNRMEEPGVARANGVHARSNQGRGTDSYRDDPNEPTPGEPRR
jgi:cell volume regulation protein A